MGYSLQQHKHSGVQRAGDQVSGWKSLMLRQSRVPVSKRALGVSMKMLGGLYGYSGGNLQAQPALPLHMVS